MKDLADHLQRMFQLYLFFDALAGPNWMAKDTEQVQKFHLHVKIGFMYGIKRQRSQC